MNQVSNKFLGWIICLALFALVAGLLSCNVTTEDGHTYIAVANDTAWTKFDRIEIAWKDTVTGTGGILYNGAPADLKESNKFLADDYKGQKIVITFKFYKGVDLVSAEKQIFDGANPGTVVKEQIPVTPIIPVTDPHSVASLMARIPKVTSLAATPDTVISINDSLSFSAMANLDSGSLKNYSWSYEEKDLYGQPSLITGGSAKIAGGHRYTKAGVYHVSLKVVSNTDSIGYGALDIQVLLDPPTANAGRDTTVFTKALIKLHGEGKDKFGHIVKTEWKIGTAPFVTGSADTSFAAPASAQDISVQFQVTDDDGQTSTGTMLVHVISENESNLTAMGVSKGSLSPQFAPSTLVYADTVQNDVAAITLKPEGSGAIKVNDVALLSGEISKPIDLIVGINTITATVQFGTTAAKTYTLKVYRLPASLNADLSGLLLSAGAISPVFASTDTFYTVSVPNGTAATTVKAILADTTSILMINGFKVASKAVSGSIPLAVGKNTITLEVTAQSGDKKTYLVQVTRLGSDIADLSALSLSAGNITPNFTTTILAYSLSVANTVVNTDVLITFAQDNATATITTESIISQPILSNKAFPVSLLVGANTIKVLVTSQSGATKTYSVQVTRAGNGNSDLSALSVSAGALSPAFSPDAVFYTLTVPNTVDSTSLTGTVSIAAAKLSITAPNTQGTVSGQAVPVKLIAGVNSISIVVTAQNGDKKSYTVVITREKNSNADLSAIVVAPDTVSPHFTASTMAYTLAVKNEVSSITVKPKTVAFSSTFGIVANAVIIDSANLSAPINLKVGANTIDVKVRAEDGTTKTYSLVISRAANGDATLSSLSISAGNLDSAFTSSDSIYAVLVDNSVTAITLTPTKTKSTALIKVNGKAVVSGSASDAVALNVDANPISVVVTAENLVTKTYLVVVTRTRNGNANLTGLTASVGAFSGAFSSSTLAYSLTVSRDSMSTTITPTAAPTSTIKVNGTLVVSGNKSPAISLSVGDNVIDVVVTAEDKTTKTYKVTVTRQANGNADLTGLSFSAGALNETFNATVTIYTANVHYDSSSTTITLAAAPTSTIKVNGTLVVSGVKSPAISLTVGANVFDVVVTAEDKTSKTYKVTVTRPLNGNAQLSSLGVSSGVFSPAFNATGNTYALSTSNTTLTVTPTVAAAGLSTVQVNGVTVGSGNPTGAISLALGPNDISIKVTAVNGNVNTYLVKVLRWAVAKVAAGTFHSLFLKTDGTMWATGSNFYGQLGDGTTIGKFTPVQIMADSRFSKIVAGQTHSLFLKTDGTLWATGSNAYGQLGDGTTVEKHTPVQIMADSTFSQIAAGTYHSLFLTTGGTLWATGGNFDGQLGDGTIGEKHTPVQIMAGSTFSQIAAGESHSLLLKTGGSLWATGTNYAGNLGDGTTKVKSTPVQIMAGSTFSQIAAGLLHSLLLKTDGTLWATGYNATGQLGDGTTINKSTPVQIMAGSTFSQIAAGESHSLLLKTDGTLWATGSNATGQLGDGTTTDKSAPLQIMAGSTFSQAAGQRHSLLLKTDGTLWATGDNGVGTFGDGTNTGKSTPVQITLP